MEELEQRARNFIKQDEIKKAISLYLELAVKFPENESYLISAANCYDKIGEKKLALELYKKALRINEQSITAIINASIIYYELQRYEKAISYSTKALEIEEDNFSALLNLANSYYAIENYQEALSYYKKIYEQNNNSYLAIINIAHTSFNLSYYVEALDFALMAIDKRPSSVEPYIIAGNAYIELSQKDNAAEMLKQASRISPPSSWLSNSIANLYHKMEDWEQCLYHAFKALRLKSNTINANDNINFGYFLYEAYEDNHQELAEKYLNQWEELVPNDPIVHHMSCAIRNIQEINSMDTSYIRGLFDNFAPSFDTILRDLNYQVPNTIAELVKNNIKSKLFKKQKILDLGCGTGLCAEALKEYLPNEEYYGIDISEKMLEYAGAKNLYKELYADDIINFFQNEENTTQYDLVIAGDVLTYIGELKILFRLLISHIKSNGMFCFSISKNIFNQSDYFLTPSGRFVHSISYVRRLLNFCGFKVVDQTECILRLEGNKEIEGYVILAKKELEVVFS